MCQVISPEEATTVNFGVAANYQLTPESPNQYLSALARLLFIIASEGRGRNNSTEEVSHGNCVFALPCFDGYNHHCHRAIFVNASSSRYRGKHRHLRGFCRRQTDDGLSALRRNFRGSNMTNFSGATELTLGADIGDRVYLSGTLSLDNTDIGASDTAAELGEASRLSIYRSI